MTRVEPTIDVEKPQVNTDGLSDTSVSSGSNSENELVEEKFQANREPLLAFIPQVAKYAGGIAIAEVKLASTALVATPSFLKNFFVDTFTFYSSNPRTLYKELISGFTVGIMLVPESIAFSFVLGLPPIAGLQTCFWIATTTGIFGGKPGMISSIAGALSVAGAPLLAENGVLGHLAPAERLSVYHMSVFTCGCLQMVFALLRLSKVTRLISETCMIGFMNGLALIMFKAQLPAFQYCDAAPLFTDCSIKERKWLTFQNQPVELLLLLIHVFLCMLVVKYFPRLPKFGKVVPSSLVALLLGTLMEQTLFRMVIGVSTRTVGETAPLNGSLPKFNFPSIPSDSNVTGTILLYGFILAAIGSIESVLTLQVCNDITGDVTEYKDSNQELFAQGLGNLMNSMFGATAGSALVGQSTINVMNGARHRVSSTFAGICVLVFSLVLTPFINIIPIGTLTGVLFMIVFSTLQMSSFVIFRYGRLSDSAAILIVTLLAIFSNLAIGIASGIAFCALVHAWDSGTHIESDVTYKPMIVNGKECDVMYVRVRGFLFFSSTRKFVSLFSVANNPSTIILDFKDGFISDHSAVAAIQTLSHRFDQAGKRLLITNLAEKSHGRLHRTGNHYELNKIITHYSAIQDTNSDEESQAFEEAFFEETNQPLPEYPDVNSDRSTLLTQQHGAWHRRRSL